jgi:hypothetical protein
VTAPRLPPFAPFEDSQSVLWFQWDKLDEPARITRLLIHVVNEIRRRLSGLGQGSREKIFVSHAKLDGDETAQRIVDHIGSSTSGLKLDTFYDAQKLETGENWRAGLEQAATSASMLALASDAYDSRPWCNQEILWAKEFGRPLLLVDVGCKRVGRSFPYAGNVTRLSDPLRDEAAIERVLLELLSEALRCDVFRLVVKSAANGPALAFPRPPELADLAFLDDATSAALVYPDPPLPTAEAKLLARLANGRKITSLSDLPMTKAPDLGGRVVAISYSPPYDLRRLGFPDREIDRIVEALCMRIIIGKGRVLYGGHLEPGNVTARMYEFVAAAYAPMAKAGEPKPFLHFLPRGNLDSTPYGELAHELSAFGSFVEMRVEMSRAERVNLIERNGRIEARGAGGRIEKFNDQAALHRYIEARRSEGPERGLTLMRDAQNEIAAARIVIGGKRGDLGVPGDADRFSNEMPGIYEETLPSIRAGKPTAVLGAYGGAARDLAIDLGLIDDKLGTPYLGALQNGYEDARVAMRALRDKPGDEDRKAMSDFALREDSEDLARDVVEWIAATISKGSGP